MRACQLEEYLPFYEFESNLYQRRNGKFQHIWKGVIQFHYMTRKFNIFWKSICRQSGRSAKVWKYLRILNWLAPLPSVSRWDLEESISPIFVRSGGCWVVAAIIAFPVSMPRLGRSFQSQDCVKRNAASTHLPAGGRDAVGVGLEKDFRKLSNSILLWSSEHPKTRWNLKI